MAGGGRPLPGDGEVIWREYTERLEAERNRLRLLVARGEHEPTNAPAYLVTDALWGLAYTVRTMRDTPAGKFELDQALAHIENECVRIAQGRVDDHDLIG